MKNNGKSSNANKQIGFKCNECNLKFTGEPYKVIIQDNRVDNPYNICNQGCWREFLDIESRFNENLFHDEVLIAYPVEQLIDFLQERSDYEEVLDYIREKIEEFRFDKKENRSKK